MPAAPGLLARPAAAADTPEISAAPVRCCPNPDPDDAAVAVTLPLIVAVRDRVVLPTAGRAASAFPRLLPVLRLISALPPYPIPPPPAPLPVAAPAAPPLRVRDGESVVPPEAAARAERASELGSWLPLLRSDPPPPLGSLLDLAMAEAVVAAVRGDNDPPAPPPPGGGLKPKRLTPGAEGGFTLDGVKGAFGCLVETATDAATDAACGGGGSPPLLAAVRGDLALSVGSLAGAQ